MSASAHLTFLLSPRTLHYSAVLATLKVHQQQKQVLLYHNTPYCTTPDDQDLI